MGNHLGRAVQRHRLEIRAAENRPVKARAVVQQVRLGNVAAHAVAQQDDRHPRRLLADMLVEARQVAHHLVPAVFLGEQPQGALVGGTLDVAMKAELWGR